MPSVPRLNGVLRELGGNVRQVRAAHAGAGGIAGLRHEAGDDAVEHDAVIELALHQLLDLRDVLGREIGPQANDDVAVLGLQHERVGRGLVGRSGEGDDRREARAAARRLKGCIGASLTAAAGPRARLDSSLARQSNFARRWTAGAARARKPHHESHRLCQWPLSSGTPKPAFRSTTARVNFGDGVYEVCEVRGGALIDEARHLARLARSLAAAADRRAGRRGGAARRFCARSSRAIACATASSISRSRAASRGATTAFPPRGRSPA